jgi:hypothetical protein
MDGDWNRELAYLTIFIHLSEENYIAIANLHNSDITTASAKIFCSLLCLQQLFSSNGFYQWRFFNFPRSRRFCPANIPQLN